MQLLPQHNICESDWCEEMFHPIALPIVYR
jgi:hypothetical protein